MRIDVLVLRIRKQLGRLSGVHVLDALPGVGYRRQVAFQAGVHVFDLVDREGVRYEVRVREDGTELDVNDDDDDA